MKTIALLVAGLFLAPAVHAQTAKAPETRKASCPCDNSNFKPLTDKARAVEAYWHARRKYKISSTLATTMAIFGIVARDGAALNEAQNGLSQAASELNAARAKAESLGALKVTGDDIDGTIELKIVKGVDYTL